MMTASEIRAQFLSFFKSKQHSIVPSAPIVVKNDPTLLFTNAGMNQFKDYFLGNKKSPFLELQIPKNALGLAANIMILKKWALILTTIPCLKC
jgi:alanyl-tRNA synthetase